MFLPISNIFQIILLVASFGSVNSTDGKGKDEQSRRQPPKPYHSLPPRAERTAPNLLTNRQVPQPRTQQPPRHNPLHQPSHPPHLSNPFTLSRDIPHNPQGFRILYRSNSDKRRHEDAFGSGSGQPSQLPLLQDPQQVVPPESQLLQLPQHRPRLDHMQMQQPPSQTSNPHPNEPGIYPLDHTTDLMPNHAKRIKFEQKFGRSPTFNDGSSSRQAQAMGSSQSYWQQQPPADPSVSIDMMDFELDNMHPGSNTMPEASANLNVQDYLMDMDSPRPYEDEAKRKEVMNAMKHDLVNGHVEIKSDLSLFIFYRNDILWWENRLLYNQDKIRRAVCTNGNPSACETFEHFIKNARTNKQIAETPEKMLFLMPEDMDNNDQERQEIQRILAKAKEHWNSAEKTKIQSHEINEAQKYLLRMVPIMEMNQMSNMKMHEALEETRKYRQKLRDYLTDHTSELAHESIYMQQIQQLRLDDDDKNEAHSMPQTADSSAKMKNSI